VSEERNRGSVGFGVLLGIGGVIAVVLGSGLISLMIQTPVIFGAALGIGVTQWLVLLPLVLSLRKRGETMTIQGILVTGGVVFLLNATCWGLVMGPGFRIR
jgi:hypothetical protein